MSTNQLDRLPDLTSEEVAALTQWGRRVKADETEYRLINVGGDIAAVPIDAGDVERA